MEKTGTMRDMVALAVLPALLPKYAERPMDVAVTAFEIADAFLRARNLEPRRWCVAEYQTREEIVRRGCDCDACGEV